MPTWQMNDFKNFLTLLDDYSIPVYDFNQYFRPNINSFNANVIII